MFLCQLLQVAAYSLAEHFRRFLATKLLGLKLFETRVNVHVQTVISLGFIG